MYNIVCDLIGLVMVKVGIMPMGNQYIEPFWALGSPLPHLVWWVRVKDYFGVRVRFRIRVDVSATVRVSKLLESD